MTVSGATLLKPSASNRTPLLLSVALFVSGSLDFILSGFNSLTSTLAAIAEIVSGVIPLVYAMFRREEHVAGARPLGITILGVEDLIAGVLLGSLGIVLLFLPIAGIIGVALIAVGAGIGYLGKALLNGDGWAKTVQTVLTFFGIVLGFVGLAFHTWNPVLAIFQIWYLRRPNVLEFFEMPYETTLWGEHMSNPGMASEKTCMACGAVNPNEIMYCSNCGIRVFSSSDGIPFAGAIEDERIVRLKLERAQSELQKMDKIKEEGKIVDNTVFEKAYSERDRESRRLKSKLESITKTTLSL